MRIIDVSFCNLDGLFVKVEVCTYVYIICLWFQNGGPDYLIPKLWSRNRAFDGDEVVIQVMPSDKWEVFDVCFSSATLYDLSNPLGIW